MERSSKVEVTGQHERGTGAPRLQENVEDGCHSGVVFVQQRNATPAEYRELEKYMRRRQLCRCTIGLIFTCLMMFGFMLLTKRRASI